MGADIIIAIHLATEPLQSDAVLSSLAVLTQSFNAVIASNEAHSMEPADILMRVDVAHVSNTAYGASAQIIAKGYEAAEQNAGVLSKLSVDDST